jgi:NADH-quinone oxidoreductase subunit N
VIILADAFIPGGLSRRAMLSVAALGIAISAWAAISLGGSSASGFNGTIRADAFSLFFELLLLAGTLLVLLAAATLLEASPRYRAESVGLVLLATAALMLLASATELITIYLALETSSLSTAFLSAWNKKDLRSNEAGLKYFVLSAIASAVLLYGIALLYGLTGQTHLEGIRQLLEVPSKAPVLLAAAMLLAGFGFKISAVPFQMWTPDVYEGAPTPITAYLSVASKAAGFAVLVRVLQTTLPDTQIDWPLLVAIVAALTMTVGNLVAMAQSNIKRMLAYSSIAQAGYVLIGVAASRQGTGPVLFYLLGYTATNLGAFIAVIEIARRIGSEQMADFAGLYRRAPGLAFALAISLLSLAGLPPLVGFFGKLFLFWAAIQANLGWLVLIGVLNSAASLFYYAQVIHTMYLLPGEGEVSPEAPNLSTGSLVVAVGGIFALGIFSAPLLGLAITAAESLP